MSRPLTDNEIKIRIVPTHLRWPDATTSEAWNQMHQCVHRLHDFARKLDVQCIQVLMRSLVRISSRNDGESSALRPLTSWQITGHFD